MEVLAKEEAKGTWERCEEQMCQRKWREGSPAASMGSKNKSPLKSFSVLRFYDSNMTLVRAQKQMLGLGGKSCRDDGLISLMARIFSIKTLTHTNPARGKSQPPTPPSMVCLLRSFSEPGSPVL